MSGKQTAELNAVLKENGQAKMGGYYTYPTLSVAQKDSCRRNACCRVAAAERHHRVQV